MRTKFDIAARIARRQHGRVSSAQLLDAGIDSQRIKRWRDDGRLRSVYWGVYAVGHDAPSLHGDYMAAVLACGEGAQLSHAADAYLLRLVGGPPPRPEVTVPTTAGRSRPGIVVHRVARLPDLDTAMFEGIPICTVPRVLLDLAPRLGAQQLGRAYHEAWVRHRTTPAHVEACIARNPRKPGIAKLRRALGADVTLSDLEDGFLALLARHGLPAPRTNIDHAGDKVDCHWPQHGGLTVELLSYRYHATRRSFEQDVARRRRSDHVAYTWGDVFERGAATAREIAALLARSE